MITANYSNELKQQSSELGPDAQAGAAVEIEDGDESFSTSLEIFGAGSPSYRIAVICRSGLLRKRGDVVNAADKTRNQYPRHSGRRTVAHR
jgi:hypothetical protein